MTLIYCDLLLTFTSENQQIIANVKSDLIKDYKIVQSTIKCSIFPEKREKKIERGRQRGNNKGLRACF